MRLLVRLPREVAFANVVKHEASEKANQMRKLYASSYVQGDRWNVHFPDMSHTHG